MELEQISGIGPKTKELLNKLDITNKKELLEFYPYKYEVLKRSDVKELMDKDKIIIDGFIEGQPMLIHLNEGFTKIIFRIRVNRTSVFNVTVYNQDNLYDSIKYGKDITVIGKFNRLKNSIIADEVRFELLPNQPKIEPIYYSGYGLKSKAISKFILSALDGYETKSILPKYLCDKYQFEDINSAIWQMHCPCDIVSLKKARVRLKYEEIFSHLLVLNYIKKRIKENEFGISRKIDRNKINKFIEKFSYSLTNDQANCIEEIISDLEDKKIMNRLLQGDVGCGKTIVLLTGMYANYLSKYQSLFIVSSDTLAVDYYNEAKEVFGDIGIKIALINGKTSMKEREAILDDLVTGKVDVVIGTNILLNVNIKCKKLGLIITDEQYRFELFHKIDKTNKNLNPDILSIGEMSIADNYSSIVYADMDISNIKTKPILRKGVNTCLRLEEDIEDVLMMVREQLKLKHQVYIVVPPIIDDEVSDISVLETLKENLSKDYKVGFINDEMDDYNDVIKSYNSSKIDVLISSDIFIDELSVKKSSMLVVFDANMYSLSMLHRVRERFGCRDIQGNCILVTKDSDKRLEVLEKCCDGFVINEQDFENRLDNDLYIYQRGFTKFRLINLYKDFNMIEKVKKDVDEFIDILFIDTTNMHEDILQNLESYV